MSMREGAAAGSSKAPISRPALTLVGAATTHSLTVLKAERHDETTTPQQFAKALSHQRLRLAPECTDRTAGAGTIGQQIALTNRGRLRGCPQ
jgi:hypothetical protein